MTTPELPPENEEFKAPPKNYKAMFVVALVVLGINLLGLWILSKR
jgi:hypothetical protein